MPSSGQATAPDAADACFGVPIGGCNNYNDNRYKKCKGRGRIGKGGGQIDGYIVVRPFMAAQTAQNPRLPMI
jgi:hypothetical protein